MTEGSVDEARAAAPPPRRSRQPAHRRSRSLRATGRHRARYGHARWLVPSLLALGILAAVTLVLVLIDATTATALPLLR